MMINNQSAEIVSQGFIRGAIKAHIQKTGIKPCEIVLPLSFMIFEGVRVRVHDQPYTITWDGENIVQHKNPEQFK
jgi:hypothetical protein